MNTDRIAAALERIADALSDVAHMPFDETAKAKPAPFRGTFTECIEHGVLPSGFFP